jgi:hypothetical protein
LSCCSKNVNICDWQTSGASVCRCACLIIKNIADIVFVVEGSCERYGACRRVVTNMQWCCEYVAHIFRVRCL